MSHLKAKRIAMNRGVYYDNRLAKYTNLPMYTGNTHVEHNLSVDGDVDISGNITTKKDVRCRSVYATGNYYLDNYVLIPAGTVIQSAAINVPDGWLNCDGSSLSTSTYSHLFGAIQYKYGGSDASFNLPDLRGRACVGAGQGAGLTNRALGSTGGSETHTLTSGQMPSHTHEITDPGHRHDWNNGVEQDDSDTGTSNNEYTRIGGSVLDAIANATTGISINNTGGGEPHNNMQPFLALHFLIKY